MTPELRVSFVISNFRCSASEVTAVLGIEPSTTWLAGDIVPGTVMRRKRNAWVLEAHEDRGTSLESQASWLLSKLPATLQELRRRSVDFGTKLSCALYVVDERPALILEARSIQRLAELGACLDIDLYVLPSDEEQEAGGPHDE